MNDTMQWIEVKVVFQAAEKEVAADLIADVFYELGVKGVVVEDPEQECLESWSEDEFVRPEAHGVIGYFPRNEHADNVLAALEEDLRSLAVLHPMEYELSLAYIDEADWAEAWKTYFYPQKITDRIVVKPTWRDYRAAPGEMVIELDPGMAFGTGTHPTTVSCVQLIQRHLRTGDRLLDVGTGSGILMIAAAKLGAAGLWGGGRGPCGRGDRRAQSAAEPCGSHPFPGRPGQPGGRRWRGLRRGGGQYRLRSGAAASAAGPVTAEARRCFHLRRHRGGQPGCRNRRNGPAGPRGPGDGGAGGLDCLCRRAAPPADCG